MRILLAQPRGFCAGVAMAVDALSRALEVFGSPLYAFHQIVHNRDVVADFTGRGVRFVDRLEEVPRGAAVVFSAHGVSPGVRAQAARLGLRVIDATCPLVMKVHEEARRFARKGYTIIFIGHPGHDETIGVVGEAPDRIRVVETLDDVNALTFDASSRLAYLTQTTLSVDDTRRLIEALEHRFPGIVGPAREDICYATQNRQAAIGALAAQADVAIVVGSRNSSNSQRLVEIASSRGARAHLVDGPEDLRAEWFTGAATVVVSAGASAPESVTRATVNVLAGRASAEVHEQRFAEETMIFQAPASVRR